MLQAAEVVEGVVSHLVSLLHYPVVEVVVSQHVLTHHEERGLSAIFLQGVEDKRCRLWYGPVVEGKVNGVVVLVHSPNGLWVNPAQPLRRLLDKHCLAVCYC